MATATPAISHSLSAGTPPDDRREHSHRPAAGAARATGRPADAHSSARALPSLEGRARIDRLRSLIARVEQSPPSDQRDAVLRDARSRVVTLDAGGQQSSAWRAKSYDRPDDPLFGLFNN